MKSDKIFFFHPTGNANVRAALTGLHQAGLLGLYGTSLGFSSLSILWSMLPLYGKSLLGRRSYDLPTNKMQSHPRLEVMRLVADSLGLHQFTKNPYGYACIDKVWTKSDEFFSRHVDRCSCEYGAVYAYEDGAEKIFETAKKRGLKCFYDLPIGYHKIAKKIFSEERELQPEFADSLEYFSNRPDKLERKDRELERADCILAASNFVRQTLLQAKGDPSRIEVVQFGAPEGIKEKRYEKRDGPLKVIMVGRLDQRKGLSYLLDAISKFSSNQIQLSLLGVCPGKPKWTNSYRERFMYLKPRVQAEVWETMKQHDVFVLPSLFEGQALVVLEAMKCGLPVIVTPNTGADEVVRDGVDGFVVPIRSSEIIEQKLAWFIQHPDAVEFMGRSAHLRSCEFTWSRYSQQIAEIVRQRMRL